MKENKLLSNVNIANYLIIKFLLLKIIGINTNNFYESIYLSKHILRLNFVNTLLNYRRKGISNVYLLKYLSRVTNLSQIRLLLDEYLLKNKVNEFMIANILERNKLLIRDIEEKINLYFIILTAILYILPIVLIVISFFLGIEALFLMIVPFILTFIIARKIKKNFINE